MSEWKMQHPQYRQAREVDYIELNESIKAFILSFGFFVSVTLVFTIIEVLMNK